MILDHIAAHPTTPRALLEHLTAHLEATYDPRTPRTDWQLRNALLSNPNITPDQVLALSNAGDARQRARYLKLALARPGTSAADAIALLGNRPTVAAVTEALHTVKDPDLDRWALAHVPSPSVWFVLVTDLRTTHDVQWAAARNLAGGAQKLRAKALTSIVRIVRTDLQYARTPEQHSEALRRLDELIEASVTDGLTERLRALDRTPPNLSPGSPAWLHDPNLDLADVSAWARSSKSRWHKVLHQARDPHGHIARAAIASNPLNALSILSGTNQAPDPSDDLPLDVCTHALAVAVSLGQQVLMNARMARIVHAGDFDVVATYLRKFERAPHFIVTQAAQRPDLRPQDIDTIVSLIGHYMAESLPGWGAPDWGAWLVTQPQATPEQRRRGLEMIRDATPGHPDANLMAQLEHLGEVALGLDMDDPASLVRVGEALPVSIFDTRARKAGSRLPYQPMTSRLLTAAIQARMPATFGVTASTVLHALAQDFPGTVGELLGTTAAIAS